MPSHSLFARRNLWNLYLLLVGFFAERLRVLRDIKSADMQINSHLICHTVVLSTWLTIFGAWLSSLLTLDCMKVSWDDNCLEIRSFAHSVMNNGIVVSSMGSNFFPVPWRGKSRRILLVSNYLRRWLSATLQAYCSTINYCTSLELGIQCLCNRVL